MRKPQGDPMARTREMLQPGRWMMSDLYGMQVNVDLIPETPVEERNPAFEEGTAVVMSIHAGKGAVYLSLTSLTAEELRTFSEVVNKAIEQAAPVCELRDRIADDAFNQGNDSFARLYRSLPRIHERKGPLREHRLSLQQRLADTPGGVGRAGVDDGGLRVGDDQLAERESQEAQREDDASSPDQR